MNGGGNKKVCCRILQQKEQLKKQKYSAEADEDSVRTDAFSINVPGPSHKIPAESMIKDSIIIKEETTILSSENITKNASPTNVSASMRSFSLTELPIDVLSCISKYFDIRSIRNLVTVLKRDEAEMIKKGYLYRNFDFFSPPTKEWPIKKWIGELCSLNYLHAWMEVNADWRQMYDQPKEHGITTLEDQNQFNKLFNNAYNSVVLAPVTVIKHLIEQRNVDVNIKDRGQYSDNCISYKLPEEHESLLLWAFKGSRCPLMIEYLLSVDGVDVNCGTLLFLAYDPCISVDNLQLLLSHKNLNVNDQPQHGLNGFTALHQVCWRGRKPSITSCTRKSYFAKARALVEAGADVSVRDKSFNLTCLDWLRVVFDGLAIFPQRDLVKDIDLDEDVLLVKKELEDLISSILYMCHSNN